MAQLIRRSSTQLLFFYQFFDLFYSPLEKKKLKMGKLV